MNSLTYQLFSLVDLFFPHHCSGCGRPWQLLCENCYEQLDFCLPLTTPKLNPCYLDKVMCCLEINHISRALIHDLKYYPIPDLAYIFGQLLFEQLHVSSTAVITSVPLHKRRSQERGYNQAQAIAHCFARLSKHQYQECLVRTEFTQPQASMQTKQERLDNVLDQFTTVYPQSPPEVVIIDDVYTTGATLNECAKVLKKAGTRHVIGIAVAHGH